MLKKISKKIIEKLFAKLFKIIKSPHKFKPAQLPLYLYILNKKIDQAFTRAFSGFLALNTELSKLKNYRIAIVKESKLEMLYNMPSGNDFKKMILNSNKHSGLVGLFTKFNADFFIIKSTDFPPENSPSSAQNNLAIKPESINWSNYDLVIAFDLAIPARIIQQNPKVLWCYLITEPLMPEYQGSLAKPLSGYDLFLNQFSASFNLFKQAPHIINFPFNLQYYGCLEELAPNTLEKKERSGIFIEAFTAQSLTKEQLASLKQFGEIRTVSPDTKTIILDLLKSKYYLRSGGKRKIWGNSLIEAVAAGCLAIGNPRECYNNLLLTRKTSTTSFAKALKKIEFFERNPQAYKKEVKKQRQILNYFFYFKPLLDLQNKTAKTPRQKLAQ